MEKYESKEEKSRMENEERYVKCACGKITRYYGDVKKAGRCYRCERWLHEGDSVRRFEWLRAQGICFFYLTEIKRTEQRIL